MIEKEEAKKASSATSFPNIQPDNNQAPFRTASPAPISFDKPVVPTPIEQTQCHMGGCIWEQITAVADVTRQGNEVLRKVISQQTDTETPEGQEYPSKPPQAKNNWKTRTSYFLCSLSRPAAIDRDSDANDWFVTQLTIVSPAGYEVAAVADYKRACHGIKPGSKLDEHSDRLGYVDRDDVNQQHIKEPTRVLR